MSQRFKSRVLAHEAAAPYNRFDSELDLPSRGNHLMNALLKKNAWLTLRMRMHLNFVDATNPIGYKLDPSTGAITVRTDEYVFTRGNIAFARDHDARDANGKIIQKGKYHRILNWSSEDISNFRRDFAERGEKRWNYRFLLRPPAKYDGLDQDFNFDTRVRPNLICLFRLELVGRHQRPHHVINVVRLDPTANPGVSPDGGTFRSDSGNYDDMDILNPPKPPPSPTGGVIKGDVVGHEIGHALGQGHVMELLGKPCAPVGSVPPGNECSGTTHWEMSNIQAWGNKIYAVNAVSWQHRAAAHCPGTLAGQWQPTLTLNVPPRQVG